MEKRVRPPLWLWINLLSLDAPVIALVWQDFLARCYPTLLLPVGRGALGLTVWAVYLADRLFDVRHAASASESIRHRFYREHQRYVVALLAVVVCADAVLAALWIHRAVFVVGLELAGCVAVYLAAFAFIGWRGRVKKPLAALLFTSGTFLVAWTNTGHPFHQLLWPAAAFCALCLGNLLMIERWSQPSLPHTRSTAHELACLMLLCFCVFCGRSSTWFAAVMISAVALAALARWGRTISGDTICVLADAVLLTPLLFR
jgi:hypothetical protein